MIRPPHQQSLLSRTLHYWAKKLRSSVARSGPVRAHDPPEFKVSRELASQLQLLESGLADQNAMALDQDLLQSVIAGYRNLEAPDQQLWRQLLASRFDIDEEALHDRMLEYLSTHRRDCLIQIRALMIPPWERLLQQIQQLPSGLEFLIELRSGLLHGDGQSDALAGFENVLHELLSQHFGPESLEIKELKASSQTDLIQRLIQHQALHEAHTPEQLQSRLEDNHRCFALFRSGLPDTPLVFVLVAQVSEMPHNIHDLYDNHLPAEDPGKNSNAVIYSVSNVQQGLEGIGLEHLLIQKLTARLEDFFDGQDACLALAPLPGFRTYASQILSSSDSASQLSQAEAGELHEFLKTGSREAEHEILESNTLFQPMLTKLCADYLLNAKNGRKAMNVIADFHLSNGATIHRIHWLGDHLDPGMGESFGIMVNYRYATSEADDNRLRYLSTGEIRYSPEIKVLQ